jgi:predicted dinucleotide-binding enzyme
MTRKTIGILGAGNVGTALARAFIAKGEYVHIGVPDPDKYRATVAALGSRASIDSTDVVLEASEIIILATPYEAALNIARMRTDWGQRILIDATNPLAPGLAGLSTGTTTSAAEEIARAARGARVVKAFNTTGAENMADSHYPDGTIFMPVCGDDGEARDHVIALAMLIGFDAVDCGDLRAARYLEPFAMTWIHMAFRMGHGRSFAFGRLRR